MDAMVASNTPNLGLPNNFGSNNARSDRNSSNQSFAGSDTGVVNYGKGFNLLIIFK